MPSETRITYGRFFSEIRNDVPAAGNEPNTILCDFELATTNSASATFPNADISGCFFHLCSNIWKKIQSLGLQVQYNNDQWFALHLRMIPALAFIPPNNIVDAFERLTDLIRNQCGDATDGVLDNFEDSYIVGSEETQLELPQIFQFRCGICLIRAHEELPRTNNHIEGWHKKISEHLYVITSNILEVYKFTEERANLRQSGYGTSVDWPPSTFTTTQIC